MGEAWEQGYFLPSSSPITLLFSLLLLSLTPPTLLPIPSPTLPSFLSSSQNASADVEKMILGNKCDLAESRVVATERGRLVSRRLKCLLPNPFMISSWSWAVNEEKD